MLPSDKLITPQSIIAYACMSIYAGGVAAAFAFGDTGLRGQAFVAAVAGGAAAYGFYLASSKGSADKTAMSTNPTTEKPTP